MLPVAEVAEVRREIVRADENPVDAVDLRDRLQMRERRARLELHEETHFVVHALEVVPDAPVTVRARRARDAAHPVRRIPQARDRALRLLDVLDVRNEERARADVE